MWCLKAPVIVLSQGIGDSSGVCGGDTSGWCRGWSPPAARPPGPWPSSAFRPWCCRQFVVPRVWTGPAAGGTPLVTTLRTRASAPRRHPQVMARRHGLQGRGLDGARQARPPRPSTFHLVPRPSISFVHATRSTCAERDRRTRSEIKTRTTRSTCQERASALHLVPLPSISFVGLPSRSFTQRDQRVRNEIDVRGTRARPGQRDRRQSSSGPPGAATRHAHPGARSRPLGRRTPRLHPPTPRSALESTVNRRCCVSGRR